MLAPSGPSWTATTKAKRPLKRHGRPAAIREGLVFPLRDSIVHLIGGFPMKNILVLGAAAWWLCTPSSFAEVVVDWSFDQSSGSVAIDSGPNRIDGTLTGDTAWAAGYGQNAIDVTGDGFVDFTQSGHPKVPSVISDLAVGSIGVRFFVDAYPADQSAHPILPIFWMGRDFGGIGQYGLTIEIGHGPPYTSTYNHQLYFTIMNGATPVQCFNTVEEIRAGQWYTFVGSVGAAGNTGYLDGLEMTDRHYNFGDATTTNFFSAVTFPSGALWVGKGFLGDETGADHFNGLIQNLRIFDQPLTAQQVSELYSVPEIDPGGAAHAVALTVGSLALAARRRPRGASA